ncbi:hypothetical protein BGZ80_006196, partial [Entomortierella chlamydospora]
KDNGIALVVGEADDLIVIDCDVLKESGRANGVDDGMAAFENLIDKHGLPENTPMHRALMAGSTLDQVYGERPQ